jgi:ribosomal protein L12E/L44/L45/RPP1/RPP2
LEEGTLGQQQKVELASKKNALVLEKKMADANPPTSTAPSSGPTAQGPARKRKADEVEGEGEETGEVKEEDEKRVTRPPAKKART